MVTCAKPLTFYRCAKSVIIVVNLYQTLYHSGVALSQTLATDTLRLAAEHQHGV
jgi:hypothetical protein